MHTVFYETQDIFQGHRKYKNVDFKGIFERHIVSGGTLTKCMGVHSAYKLRLKPCILNKFHFDVGYKIHVCLCH